LNRAPALSRSMTRLPAFPEIPLREVRQDD
jgi:hypothetical protein